jgi:hypothetical protein
MPKKKDRSVFSDRLRLILLLDACEAADLSPVPLARFHAIAFLANVLSPVWSVESYDGKILKRQGGPFYPALQYELDALIGIGVANIHNVRYLVETDESCRLDGTLSLNIDRSRQLISVSTRFEEEREISSFLRRLAFAASRLHRPVEDLVAYDPTWADRRTGTGDVIDFAEWSRANYSAFAAESFDGCFPNRFKTGSGEKLQLFMRLLEQRANGTS